MALTVASREPRAGVRVLDLSGALDREARGPLADALAGALAGGAGTVGLHFAGLTRIDGFGLTVLFRWCLSAERRGLRVVGFGLPGRLRELLEEVGLGRHLALYASEARALGTGGSGSQALSPVLRSVGEWAGHLGRVRLSRAPAPFPARLVRGLAVEGPAGGFGQLWDKTYEVRLPGVSASPREAVAFVKEHLGELWPDGAELYAPPPGIAPGAAGVIRLTLPGGVPLVTGIRVLHAGQEAFTFATLRGHMEAGWITFGARRDGETTVVCVESLARTGDPLFELGFLLFGHAEQERFWVETLTRLAGRLGAVGEVGVVKSCADPSRRWAGVANLPANAAARTALYTAVGVAARLLGRRRRR
ncbi:MAG: hypothetical protein Kow0092_15970 [Deferrisomatales bacterium]